MRSIFYAVTMMMVMVLAFWAYNQNYRTQASLREVKTLRAEIADLRERAGVRRAEWAYLNRPERLADLADMVKAGIEFVVEDTATGDDLTSSVLIQIIAEQEAKPGNKRRVGFAS